MDVTKLTPWQRQHRQNIRNFLLNATIPEMEREKEIHLGYGDSFGGLVIDEFIAEVKEEPDREYL